MKHILNFVFMAVLLLGCYAVLSPYIVKGNIKAAVEENNLEKLSKYVNYPVLRGNLKKQFHDQFLDNGIERRNHDPFGKLAYGLASGLIDTVVDSYVTPEGVARILAGESFFLNLEPQTSQREGQTSEEVFQNARDSYDTFSQFSIWLPNNDDQEIRIILVRYNLDWKLTNIILPTSGKSNNYLQL